jgi:citrate/tricarballylate utilization protein
MMDELFAEAQRQLNICNSCRYCEGYCAVFPALERRSVLDAGDLTHLANLCHDCRACLAACMYAAPHEFALNPPEVLSDVRLATYEGYVSPRAWPAWLRRWTPAWLRDGNALLSAAILVAAALLALVALTEGINALLRHGGPYQVIPYPGLLVTVALPSAWSVAVMIRAFARYWHDTYGPLRDAARLRYLRGGGAECYYRDANPSPARRRLHAAVFYGFLACFAATLSAGFMQDILGDAPPYPLLSVPVILGTAGGLGMIVGCAGLTVLKRASDPSLEVSDYSLLIGLGALALTGLLTLLVRATPAYGLVLVAHLATIVICFGIAPYTRFVHFGYRFLALVADNLERAGSAPAPDDE